MEYEDEKEALTRQNVGHVRVLAIGGEAADWLRQSELHTITYNLTSETVPIARTNRNSSSQSLLYISLLNIDIYLDIN
jgi:hypothetical protein